MLPGRGTFPWVFCIDLPALPCQVWPGYEGGPVQLLYIFVCPNSLTFCSVFYHVWAVEATPVLRAGFIPWVSSSRLAAVFCCSLPLHFTIAVFWCFGTCGSGLSPSPKCMVPGACSGWSITERLIAGTACVFFHTEASINCVQVSGPEAISSVKICAFQWPFDAAVVCCLAHVHCSAVPVGWGWRLEKGCCHVFLQNCKLIKLFIDWMVWVCVCADLQQVYFPEQMVCLPLGRT